VSARPAGEVARATAAALVELALSQLGKAYVWGAEVSEDDPNPKAFDCSELVEWACRRLGVKIVDGSAAQHAWCRAHDTMLDLDVAIATAGALLFREGHVAISLGNGHTIEAKGRAYGVVEDTARGRFTAGARVPGLEY
jgi:cell wall-associated NlpC family hydrolase